MSRARFASTGRNYEVDRASYADAGPWDRAVRHARAAERLRAQGAQQNSIRVEERDGLAVLVDTANPNRTEAL